MGVSKGKIIENIVEKEEITKAMATRIVNEVFDSIIDTVVAGETAAIDKFGTFSPAERAARKGRNPQTGEELVIPASKTVKFKPAKSFKDTLKG